MKSLTVMERLLANSLLPNEGNYTDLKLIREARESLSFTEEEHLLLKFRFNEGKTEWDNAIGEKEINIGSVASKKIRDALEQMDKDGKLKEDFMSLYEKFVGE